MKTIKKILLVALLGFLALGLRSQNITQVREVKNFTQVDLSIAADLFLSQGEIYKHELEGSESDLNKIETAV